MALARPSRLINFYFVLNQTDTNGIRLDVSNPDALGPLYSTNQALDSIQEMLNLGMASLTGSTVSFPLSSGFNGFNDASGLLQFNRALAARVDVYRQDWNNALTDVNASFYGLNKDLYLGVYSVFGTGSGDQVNPAFIPQMQTGEVRVANPSYAQDIIPGDDRISKATLRPTATSQGLSSDRDAYVGIYFQYRPHGVSSEMKS